jgi:hypothetical protein
LKGGIHDASKEIVKEIRLQIACEEKSSEQKGREKRRTLIRKPSQ